VLGVKLSFGRVAIEPPLKRGVSRKNISCTGTKRVIDCLMKHLITALPTKAWIFIFILSLAPIIVGITEGIFLTDWPDNHPLLGDLVPDYQPRRTVIIQSVGLGIVLVFSGWLMLFIPTLKRFQQLPRLIRVVILGILVLLLLGLLWLELDYIFMSIFSKFHTGPVIGLPVPPRWIVSIGLIWTIGIILFTSSYFKQQFIQLQEK
jgi:hypothetical protein